MTKQQHRQEMLIKGFAPDVVEKALQKAARWMKNAFGEVSWHDVESGTMEAFCNDTIRHPDGRGTFNRGRK